MSLGRLRKTAESHFCEKCYRKYIALIEPTIKRWLTTPLRDWGEIEHYVTQMVRKLEGVFKAEKGPILVSIGDDEELPEDLSDTVDLEAFRKFKRKFPFRTFKWKINYLRKHGILQNSSYKLLDILREFRNKLHGYDYKFTEQELNLFTQARAIVSMMHWAVMWIQAKDRLESYKVAFEKRAEQLLSAYFEMEAE